MKLDLGFEARCKTTDGGFVNYDDSKMGLCIISLPNSEEVITPEYIDVKQVKQLGYQESSIYYGNKTHTVDESKVKILTIHHHNSFSVNFEL